MFYLCNITYIVNISYFEVKNIKFTKQYLTINFEWFQNQKIQNVKSTLLHYFIYLFAYDFDVLKCATLCFFSTNAEYQYFNTVFTER